ncbi:hypothetical protein BJ742DRAFT_874114 [Cladochytrium replicatum]|nr:hypothetical protein BJ742DRAFT_874114 [Cladochytrium replicatum]
MIGPQSSYGNPALHPPLEAQNTYDDLNRRFRPALRLPAMLDKWGAALKSLYESHPECVPERALRKAGWNGTDDRSQLTVKFAPGARLRGLPDGYATFEIDPHRARADRAKRPLRLWSSARQKFPIRPLVHPASDLDG